MEKSIVFRVHLKKLTINLQSEIKLLIQRMKENDCAFVNNIEKDGQTSAFLHAIRSVSRQKEKEKIKKCLKSIEDYLIRHLLINDKLQISFNNLSLSKIEIEDSSNYIKFIFS